MYLVDSKQNLKQSICVIILQYVSETGDSLPDAKRAEQGVEHIFDAAFPGNRIKRRAGEAEMFGNN